MRLSRSSPSTSRTCAWYTSPPATSPPLQRAGSLAASWRPSPKPWQPQKIVTGASSKCLIGFPGRGICGSKKISKQRTQKCKHMGESYCCLFSTAPPEPRSECWNHMQQGASGLDCSVFSLVVVVTVVVFFPFHL